MFDLSTVLSDLQASVEELQNEVTLLRQDNVPMFFVGRVVDSINENERGKVTLQTVKPDGTSLELSDRAASVEAFNGTGGTVDADEQVSLGRDAWGQWHIVKGGSGGTAPIVPVVLEQVGGSQGDGESPATWTYDAYLAPKQSGDTEILDEADPVASPHHYARPNVGQVEPANFGLAWKIKKDPPPPEGEDPYEYELTWINEAIIGAICEEEEEEGGGEG